MPDAAKSGSSIEEANPETQLTQLEQLIEPIEPGSNNNSIELLDTVI